RPAIHGRSCAPRRSWADKRTGLITLIRLPWSQRDAAGAEPNLKLGTRHEQYGSPLRHRGAGGDVGAVAERSERPVGIATLIDIQPCVHGGVYQDGRAGGR